MRRIDVTPDGKTLILVQSNTGKVVLAGGESLTMGDGVLLHGRTLYVVQNQPGLVRRGAAVEEPRHPARWSAARGTRPSTCHHERPVRFPAVRRNAHFGTPKPASATSKVVTIATP